MAILISGSVNENLTQLTIKADTGVGEIATLYVYLNDFSVAISQDLLSSPGFNADDELVITEADLAELFEDNLLKDGIYVVVAVGADTTNQSTAIDIVHKEIDCCLAQNLDGDESEGPIFTKRQEKATRVFLLLQGAKIAAERKNLTATVDKYQAAEDLCAGCGCNNTVTKIANKSYLS